MHVSPRGKNPDGTYNSKIACIVSPADMLDEFLRMWHGESGLSLLMEATAVKRDFGLAIEEVLDQLSKGAIRHATKREQIFMVTAMTLAMVGFLLEKKK